MPKMSVPEFGIPGMSTDLDPGTQEKV